MRGPLDAAPDIQVDSPYPWEVVLGGVHRVWWEPKSLRLNRFQFNGAIANHYPSMVGLDSTNAFGIALFRQQPT